MDNYNVLTIILNSFLPMEKELFLASNPYLLHSEDPERSYEGMFPRPDYFILPNEITAVSTGSYAIIYKDNKKDNVGLDCKRSMIACIPMIERTSRHHRGVYLVISAYDLKCRKENNDISLFKTTFSFMAYHKRHGNQPQVMEDVFKTNKMLDQQAAYVAIDGLFLIDKLSTMETG